MSARMVELVRRLGVAGSRRDSGWSSTDAYKAVVEALHVEHVDHLDRASGGHELDRRTDQVARVFGLAPLEADLLWGSVAAHLDVNVALAYGLLQGATGMAHPSAGLLLELAGVRLTSRDAGRVLAAGAALRRHGLLEVCGTGPWPSRTVEAGDVVVAAVLGAEPDDPHLAALVREVEPVTTPGSAALRRALDAGVGMVWVRSPALGAGPAAAAAGLRAAGLRWLAVDVAHVEHEELPDVLARAVRCAGLRREALLLLGAEALAAAGGTAVRTVTSACVPVVCVSTRAWDARWAQRTPLVLDVAALDPAQRQRLWDEQLVDVLDPSPELRDTLVALRLPPPAVAETVRYARVLAGAQDEPVSPSLLRQAARQVSGTAGSSVGCIDAGPSRRPTLEDLVLPEPVMLSLRRLVRRARYRDRVTAHGALARGRAVTALFSGGPGTGKTLAAHVVAEELSLELFQVDLSAIVDKYIGETEKHLEAVFQTAEAMDVVLFFDEADALFGNRSEVKDARDRYANQEVAYLLQRMEQFDGITLLATNLRSNLDEAFSRRLSTVIAFPDPDLPTRERLWQAHLAQLHPLDPEDPVDVAHLARSTELTGGDIRNVVLAAAYDGIAAGEPVGMRHLLDALRQEHVKLGRMAPVGL